MDTGRTDVKFCSSGVGWGGCVPGRLRSLCKGTGVLEDKEEADRARGHERGEEDRAERGQLEDLQQPACGSGGVTGPSQTRGFPCLAPGTGRRLAR